MLYALFVCSDDRCDAAYEGWCEPDELDSLNCEDCDSPLRAVAYSEGGAEAPRRREVQRRRAA
jgi:hypothetical protein